MARTAVLIVAYNTKADVQACLRSLLASGAAAGDIYVADNASRDGTANAVAEEYSGVHLVRNDQNLYYARATNQLLDAVDADFYLLLNPDTRPDFKALTSLLGRFQAAEGIAAVAPQLRFPDGRVQPSCRRLPDAWTPWRELFAAVFGTDSHWKMSDFDHRSPRIVEQPMFSCIWISRAALADVGHLDSAYPLFMNDVDWCRRAHERGWKIWFEPSVAVEHARGGTTGRYRWRRLWHSHRSLARYIWRNQGNAASAVIGVGGAWLSLVPRAVAGLFQQK